MSEKIRKRTHSEDRSKKLKRSKNSDNKSYKDFERKAIFSEDDGVDFELEKAKRRDYVNQILMKREGLNLDDRATNCPYLDTIDRSVLDFDFEKLCSISLTHLNVYACLVCGLYFQGRGTSTHAHTHSVDKDHHVFLNLETHRFYCLPENYEIIDSSLEDITYLLSPTFTKDQIKKLDKECELVRAYNNNLYYPGIVGLNNIKANDYCNVILQLLSHVTPIRNYFLQESNYSFIKTAATTHMNVLVQRFGELIRKLWNPRNFKTHVSPHEFLQAVVLCSKKQFQFTVQGNAVEFCAWIINTLHLALKSHVADKKSTIFSKTFRGKMKVISRKVLPVNISNEDRNRLLMSEEYQEKVEIIPFFFLTCDLPSPPLFKDELLSNDIPQVFLGTLLDKFNGIQAKEYNIYPDLIMKRVELHNLPPFLILTFRRFVHNHMLHEKYPTIVTFPLTNFDFGDLLQPDVKRLHKHTTYDLVANVSHEGTIESGTYKIHLKHTGSGKWYSLQDLRVDEAFPEMIPLNEVILQVWKVNKDVLNPFYQEPVIKNDTSMPPPPPPKKEIAPMPSQSSTKVSDIPHPPIISTQVSLPALPTTSKPHPFAKAKIPSSKKMKIPVPSQPKGPHPPAPPRGPPPPPPPPPPSQHPKLDFPPPPPPPLSFKQQYPPPPS